MTTGMPYQHPDQITGAAFTPPQTGRALALSWLADLFIAPPGKEAIASWRRGDGAKWLTTLADDPVLGEGVSRLVSTLTDDCSDTEMTSRLGIAFGRLFLGIGGPSTVPPYESAYSGDGRLFGPPVTEMRKLIAANGLDIDPSSGEAADHISVELTLAAHLVFNGHSEAGALFARLRDWVPEFCTKCIERDTTGYWAGAARALADLVAAECRILEVSSAFQTEDRNFR